jgi:hypothetical protein
MKTDPEKEDRLRIETTKVILEGERAQQGAFYIHVPEIGCPDGWLYVEDLFREKDGSTKPGCVLLKQIAFGCDFAARCDYLLPGESFSLFIPAGPIPEKFL